MASLKCISVNARGLNSKEKREKFYNWISDSKFDVIFLQETHFIEKNIFFSMIVYGTESLSIVFLTLRLAEESLFYLDRV